MYLLVDDNDGVIYNSGGWWTIIVIMTVLSFMQKPLILPSVDFAGPGLFTAAHNEWHSQGD